MDIPIMGGSRLFKRNIENAASPDFLPLSLAVFLGDALANCLPINRICVQ
ncbi:hypothetical protein [Burkholderia sp. L27(2015)]|nr:hypothetical protein [Burkholderia sp. L27(2015)]